ncbi:hypothetical protein LOK55_12510 [Microbacterium sp. F2E]|uniref:hypothetical protein n=1 Tax=Microbacterium sp. F2E TaxID=2895284 RepID=UPI001E364E72|nr:hypothetical protein [Microbacterium sp. F2E]MCC9055086.1 hypothetical protein [Microbacterium sp. F2E]
MAEGDSPPVQVLTSAAVRWSIDALGVQRLHPTFVMYLYIRALDRAGTLENASASDPELLALITMPGNPTKPYYFPLIDRGDRTKMPLPSFWRSRNIPGSWSPGSIRRLQGGGWLGASESAYVLPPNHVDLAFDQMLYGKRTSALALGAYFLRNDGFHITGEPSEADVVAGFRSKFDYPAEADDEFHKLFHTETPGIDLEWFEPQAAPNDALLSTEMTDLEETNA